MEKTIDIGMLRAEIKSEVARCVRAKTAFREAQRAASLAPKDMEWRERQKLWNAVNSARSEAGSASYEVTKLCVFKAHLRGRKHLSENSFYADQVDGWIYEQTKVFAKKEQAA